MQRRNVLNRAFSTREKVLILILAVLVIVAGYYFLVVKNVADTKAANDIELADVQDQIVVQQTLASMRENMQKELDALGEGETLPEVAVYDNFRNEFDELNATLAATSSFNMTFKDPVADGSLVRRQVSITFTVPSYEAATSVVKSLANGPYRCQLSDFAFTGKMRADGSIDSVSATLNMTFYETTKGATTLSGLTISNTSSSTSTSS